MPATSAGMTGEVSLGSLTPLLRLRRAPLEGRTQHSKLKFEGIAAGRRGRRRRMNSGVEAPDLIFQLLRSRNEVIEPGGQRRRFPHSPLPRLRGRGGWGLFGRQLDPHALLVGLRQRHLALIDGAMEEEP